VQEASEDLIGRVRQAVDAGGIYSDRTDEELVAEAAVAVEFADYCADRPEVMEELAEANWAFDEWALNLPRRLQESAMIDEALRVTDALGATHRGFTLDYSCEAARILAESGRADEARGRLQHSLERFGDIPYTWMAAGETLVALGDLNAATAAYDKAVELAEDRDDPTEISDAYEHQALFVEKHPDAAGQRQPGPRTRVRVLEGPQGEVVVRATTTVVPGFGSKVPRNAPCPCGSGRKYKHCCGRR